MGGIWPGKDGQHLPCDGDRAALRGTGIARNRSAPGGIRTELGRHMDPKEFDSFLTPEWALKMKSPQQVNVLSWPQNWIRANVLTRMSAKNEVPAAGDHADYASVSIRIFFNASGLTRMRMKDVRS